MPSIGDVSVHVLDSHGTKHEEWGVQRLHPSKDQTIVSAYIKSESGMAFSIGVEAKIPYVDYSTDGFVPSSSKESNETFKRPGMKKSHPRQKHQSSPIPTVPPPSSPPPFDLLATLYLDGRKNPERRTIIYLDPEYADFLPGPEGQGAGGVLKSRWVTGKDGKIYEQAWVFKDVGIEAILDKMVLMANDDLPKKDEDDLVDAFNRTGMRPDEDLKREENKKIGQIVVEIMRITIGKKKIDGDYRPRHQEGEDEDVDMERINSELSHTTAFSQIGALNARRIPIISYLAYQNNEDPFAIFKFFYRSQATLEKFHFPGFPMRENRVIRKRDHMDTVMNDMAPLGISSGRVSTSKSKRYEGKASFEEQIKKGRSKKELVPEFNFDDQNRRLNYAKAEQSSQSDTNLPSHNNHRRPGVKSIKNEFGDEKENISISPNRDSEIAADGSATFSTSSAERDRKIVNDGQTLDPNDPYHGSAHGLSFGDPNQRAPLATMNPFSSDPLANMQVNKIPKPAALSSFSGGKSASRGDPSSDADDEKDPSSDLETSCASESDMEFDLDDGPSLNKDDGGLGVQLHETLRFSNKNGKRIRDALDEGENEETRRGNTEEGQSQLEDARDEMGEGGAGSTGDKAAGAGERRVSLGKRVKVASDLA
ncbi:MAG: hypothetical protein Q9195_002051 [Heterodermia aff. obscurata]